MNSKVKKIVIYGTITTLLCSKIKLIEFNNDNFYNKISNYEYKNENDFTIYAHRGFSSLEIENSKEAIDICSNYEYIDGIEIDIAITKDDKLVLLHTDKNGYNYNLKKPVYEYLLSELEQVTYKVDLRKSNNQSLLKIALDPMSKVIMKRTVILDDKQTTVMTLDELLLNYQTNQSLMIDIKFNQKKDIMINKMLDKLNNLDCTNIIIQSDDYDGLTKMKKINPNLNYQLIISNKEYLQYLNSDFNRFAIKHSLLNYNMVKNLIEENKKVAIWTINDSYTLSTVIKKLGKYANEVIYLTDFPDCLSLLLEEKVSVK